MPAVKTLKIESLSAFSKQIETLLSKTKGRISDHAAAMNWYRGHSSSSKYRLEPGLYRHPSIKKFEDLLELEANMMNAFRRQGMLHDFKPSIDTPNSGTMQLFYMQHHGVPTRLLDWTSNPFIALYFALSGAKQDSDTGAYRDAAAVWVLDPFSWNDYALGELKWGVRGPADIEDDEVKSYLPAPIKKTLPIKMYPRPIALMGKANTARMLAQKGHFTLFGSDTRSMEEIYHRERFPDGCLVKLEVPASKISNVLGVLLAVGYTDSVAFPDLQGLAMEIKRLHGFTK